MDGTAYIGLGSNLGDRVQFLRRALAELRDREADVISVSHLYETAPMYVLDQPPFLNAAARLATDAAPEAFLDALLEVERQLDRTRPRRFGPRTIDLDLLLWGSDGATVRTSPQLAVPHPRLLERAFALLPLADIAPHVIHPLCGRSIGELAGLADRQGVVRVAGPGWAEELP